MNVSVAPDIDLALDHPIALETHHHSEKKGIMHYLWSYDHKMIGLQYLWTAFLFFLLGGALAMAVRYQLGFPNHPVPLIGRFLPSTLASDDGTIIPGGYNMLVTMHATIMVFFVVMPLLIGAFGNYLIPLKIGAGDMAFPLLNEVSYWLYVISGFFILAAFFAPGGAPGTGWTAYAPLSAVAIYNQTQVGQSLWGIAIFINGLASIAGATNYITTIITMRAPGMTMFRLPLTVWSLLITSILLIFAVPVLSAAAAMLFFDLNFGTSFFKPAGGGQPLLWQHLFWFFGHPEVYIMILPAMGLVSEIMPVFARKPVFGYKAMVYAMASIGLLGFIVWGHHMFVSGMNLTLSATFAVSTMVIAVPSGIKTFNWLGTVWKGSIEYTVPMCFTLAFVSMFVIGGLSGIFMASTPVDLFVHHTYFIVAHFHYVLFGGSLFAIFSGIYFWFPKMFGRMMNPTLGMIHFIATFLFFNLTFFPMHNLGLGGMMRRIADPTVYEHLRQLQPLNVICTIGAFGLGLSTLVFFVNLFYSIFKGPQAPDNPWLATTLEWTISSPPGHGNFPITPIVYNGPYEYSVPGMDKDYLPQNEKAPTNIQLEIH
ncbi:MAG: cbb3-type cytochrome c oxidase subunit I [Verrucomicrobiae bacterium]|jgi:cytochrome c oxidase subunit 1|nr:cbb3-type cytochrome c oxidase subunit I [Verrucomicrobiae bacterium]